jgi:hypothetical protein
MEVRMRTTERKRFIYLFEGMVDNGGEIFFWDLGKHLTDSTGDVVFTPFLGHWAAMKSLSGRVALDLLLYPILSIGGRGLFETPLFAVLVAELAARKLDDFQWEVVTYAVYVVGELLRIGVGLVLRLGLQNC